MLKRKGINLLLREDCDKKTFDQVHMDQLTLSVDIYAITFLSYVELDAQTPRQNFGSQALARGKPVKSKSGTQKSKVHIPNN